jgi:hypothetical protein
MSRDKREEDGMDVHGDTVLDDRSLEALITGRPVSGCDDLAAVLALLAAAGQGRPPAPNASLAAMLDDGFTPVPAQAPATAAGPARRRRTWALRVSVGLAAFTTSTLTAATANALPGPLQNAVADAVTAWTPFEVPRTDAPADVATELRGDVRPRSQRPAEGDAARQDGVVDRAPGAGSSTAATPVDETAGSSSPGDQASEAPVPSGAPDAGAPPAADTAAPKTGAAGHPAPADGRVPEQPRHEVAAKTPVVADPGPNEPAHGGAASDARENDDVAAKPPPPSTGEPPGEGGAATEAPEPVEAEVEIEQPPVTSAPQPEDGSPRPDTAAPGTARRP